MPDLRDPKSIPTAIVWCEGNFGRLDGKTANGLVRSSEAYRLLSVIDSTCAGVNAGTVLNDQYAGIALDGQYADIPILSDLAQAIAHAGFLPDMLIIGLAPTDGLLAERDRAVLLQAMALGMGIVNGLHEFLADDAEFAAASRRHDVPIRDVRRPAPTSELRMFTGRIDKVTCPVIAILGTDGAIGKRTTATVLTRVLCDAGIRAVMVSTGQTGLIQGARFGIALDAIPAQFGIGEVEGTVLEAFESLDPDVIIVEGQGALSHPAYISSTIVLRGSRPSGVILQHAPGRRMLSDFPDVPMPTASSEIRLIEAFADTTVIGLTINHEAMTDAEVSAAIAVYEVDLGLPVTDALARPAERLVEMVTSAFPHLVRSLGSQRV